MIIFGFAKTYYYSGDNTLHVQVRIPSIHGPYKMSDANGKTVRNYVRDEDLPFFQSILLPHLPNEGDVVALEAINESNNDFIVIGLTGASYTSAHTQ